MHTRVGVSAGNGIGPRGASHIADSLESNHSLHTLDLFGMRGRTFTTIVESFFEF